MDTITEQDREATALDIPSDQAVLFEFRAAPRRAPSAFVQRPIQVRDYDKLPIDLLVLLEPNHFT